MFPGQSNDKGDDSDYPDLTSDSGDDSDSDDEVFTSKFRVPGSELNKQTNFLWPITNGSSCVSDSKNSEVLL